MAIGVTQEDVWLAADAVLREGARPTIERVRQRLGRGSPNTVGPHLDAWFRSLGPRLDGVHSAASAAADTPDAVARATTDLWRLAQSEARTRAETAVADGHRRLEEARQALERERQALAQREIRIQARETDLQDTLTLLRHRLQAAEGRIEELEDERRAHSSRLAQALELQSDIQQAHDALAAELAAERSAQAAERERMRESAHAQEKRWLLEIDAARTANRRLQQKYDQDIQAALKAAETLRKELAAARNEAGSRAAALAQAQAGLDAAREMTRVQTEHLRALRTQLDAARDVAQAQTETHTRREREMHEQVQRQHQQVEQVQSQLSRLLEQLDLKERELAALRPRPRRKTTP